MKRRIALLVNPFIYDFAAYNFWSSPLGLLYIGAILRQNGFEVNLVDCMQSKEKSRKADGRAPFISQKVAKPTGLSGVKRQYRRYGMAPDVLRATFSNLETPDFVLITSIMTYWYAGTQEAVRIARESFPHSKIVVGGIYPSLCNELARFTLHDAELIAGANEIQKVYTFIEQISGVPLAHKPDMNDLDILPYPCYDLYESIPFVPLITSFGCAFKCSYCATPYLYPRMIRRGPLSVLREIEYWLSWNVRRFVIYDDSFLYDREHYAKPLLRGIQEQYGPLEIYNPNAMNAAFIDRELSELLIVAGFKEVRIGFETADPEMQRTTGGKVTCNNFETAISALQGAGFKGNIIAYVMAGLPFQKAEDVRKSIEYVSAAGATPYLAEYTPIPHTKLFDEHRRTARYPIDKDAIYQNNALFPFAWEGFTEEDLRSLKMYLNEIRR